MMMMMMYVNDDDDDDDDDVLTVHQVVQMVEWEWQTKMYLCTANAEKFNIYLPKKKCQC